MEIKRFIFTLMFFNILLQSCGGQNPTNSDIIGNWHSKDGTSFQFNRNGKFYAANLPRGTMYFPEDQLTNTKFSGLGEWSLQKGQSSWEVKLIFDKSKNLPTGYSTQIEIAGSKGALDNRPPWYLFEWKDGEGSEKYIFNKATN